MIRGIYTAASGMLAEAQRTDVISNNLANVTTAGFKKDMTITKDFASILVERVNDGAESPVIGNMGLGVVVDEVATDHSTGAMNTTSNAFDFAIAGKGYFVVQTPQGTRYTRNGTFAKSVRGQLVTSDGYQVLGQNGPITVGNGKMSVSEDGRIFVGNNEVGKLNMVEFDNDKQLTKEGAGLFIAQNGQQSKMATGSVRQGVLEMSNVNVVGEMVNLISNFRAYEINGKVIQSHDQLLGKAVNEVGKL